MRALTRISALIAWIVITAGAAAAPQYQIYDIGVVQAGDTASQGFGASPGGVAVGRSFRANGAQAFSWTVGGGLVALPNLAGRNYAVSNDANDNGIVVGTAATTAFGSARLPVVWQSGVVSQLPLPAGETLGDANGVNASGVAVGSVDGGSLQQAVIYDGGSATVITQTTSNGSFFVTAFGINDSGRIVGQGIDPTNAARNVGIVYDRGSATAFEVGALPGANGALAFGVGNGGHVVGSSMMNQGSGRPFIWSDANGIVAIPLATGTSEGSARAVNSTGWVVGQDSSAFSIPFFWDGTTTYRLADLLPAGSGWDLDMNTSSSALGISDSGVIVGTGVHNGETHAYAMVPVTSSPTPSPTITPTPTATATPTPTPTPIGIDLGVSMTDAPDPVQVGQDLTYTITVFNNVPDTALGVTMTDALPSGVNYVSATPSQGSCTGTSTVTCNLGTIPGSASATVILVVTPTVAGQLSNTAVVPYPGDPNPSNNSATQVTTVIPEEIPTPTPTPTTTPTTTPTPTPTTTPATTPPPTPSPTPAARALNLSTRMRVQTGDNVGIGGFIVTGSAAKHVLLRAIGPSLAQFGVPNALADPVLELHGPGPFATVINDNWKDDPVQRARIEADGIPPTNDLESAIDATLIPGNYTAVVRGKDNTSGVALVEVYDLTAAVPEKLANISTRAFVDTGDNIVIAGFILGSQNGTDRIVIRGIGPSLAVVGVINALADPRLELRNSDGTLLRANNNWQDNPAQAAELFAAGLAPTDNLESGIAATLSPGLYTALLAGVNNGTGIGLVEVYDRGTP
jgi:uncharacterized repeat protein (TIGR01451 family)